jgi:hypothetical protein
VDTECEEKYPLSGLGDRVAESGHERCTSLCDGRGNRPTRPVSPPPTVEELTPSSHHLKYEPKTSRTTLFRRVPIRDSLISMNWKRPIFALFAVLLFFGVAEFVLWAAGVESLLARRDPFQGFSGTLGVFELDEEGSFIERLLAR